ncbi:hypothetical protein [Hymenobacter sp. AT01-02]|uniref:hypothetical protein n=1 Tax=Hymenobacter sp. AT01-02 TaxID=1571877 RepID=UPI0005F20D69|nr:hypothetical protein [Hymenobacter sp. AT01-02]
MYPHIVPEFPEGREYWMVMWVYLVTLEENEYRFTVDLAEIKDVDVVRGLKPYNATNYTGQHRTVQVGHAFLPLMEIGSIWHQKRLVFSPATGRHPDTTMAVSIADSQQGYNIPLHALSQRIDPISRFPPYRHPNGSLLSSLCYVLDSQDFTIRNGERIDLLILPPAEILRFYYCGSANLLKQVLSNGIPYEQVYLREATRYDPVTQELYIRMRGHLRDSDAHFVGRLAGDQTAHQVTTELGKRIQQNLINHRQSYLEAGLPFTGQTKLHVTGKWIKTLTDPKSWAFMVYTIVSCSAKLPYRHLHYYRENDASKTPDPLQVVQAPEGAIREASPPAEGASISSTAAASSEFATGDLAMLTPAEKKFLQAPPATRIAKEQQLTTTVGSTPHWYVQLPSYTVSDGNAGSVGDVVGPLTTEINDNERKETGTGVTYAQFHLLTEQLRALTIACSYIDYSKAGNSTGGNYSFANYLDFPYPPVSTSPLISRWLPFHSPREKDVTDKRRRRVVVLQLVYGATTFYLIECEARKTENFSRLLLKPNTPSYNLEVLLTELLTQLAAHKGIWKRAWKHEKLAELDVAKQAIHHGAHDTPAQLAARVVGYLKEM